MFATMPSVLPLIEAGTVRALAVTSAARSPFLPNVPSVAEAAVPGFDVSSWYGLFLPAKTPGDIVRKVYADAATAIDDPQIKRRFSDLATVAESSSPTELTALLKGQLEKWGPIIKELGIKAD
jgi:tripartite-type tricarboxylate transporter receptor subunit TctC